jgi:hypothetical protein
VAPETNGNHAGSRPPALVEVPLPDATVTRTQWAPRRGIAVMGAAAMLLLVVTVAFARQRGWLRPASVSPTFAVGLIREDEPRDSLQASRVLTDMLATNLARVSDLRVLANSRLLELMRAGQDSAAVYSDAARRAGATELFEGHLYSAPETGLTLEVRRVELRTGILKDVYVASAANRYALVDSMTRLIANQLRLARPEGSVADATTSSLVAYRFYEEGVRAFYQGDGKAAQRLMRAALVEDSTFAMAAWYEALLAGAPGITPDGRHVTEARRTALRLAERAPDRERLTITANILAENQEPSALAVAESLNTRFPDDPRALMTLARVRGAIGDWSGAVGATERAIALDSAAETGGPSICRVCDGFAYLGELYLWWDSLPAAQRTARRFLSARPTAPQPLFYLAVSSARLGDSATAYARIGASSPWARRSARRSSTST